jgi:AmiR/NasT family two-component response regulator
VGSSDLDADVFSVLIANERHDRLDRVASIVRVAGHEVTARAVRIDQVAEAAREVDADVAIVAAGESDEHALELIERLVEEAECPVILHVEERDPDFVREAARRGVYGLVHEGDAAGLDGSIEIALRRYAELRDLEAAFRRRAVVERAKGVLMERHGIDDRAAFALLRDRARARQQRVVTVARAVLDGHALLPAR